MFSWKRHVPNQFECFGIDDVNQVCASSGFIAATFHIVVLVYRIENRAIDGGGKFDLIEDAIIFPTHQFSHPKAVTVSDNEIIGLRQKNNCVGLSETCDAFDAFTSHQIENLDGLVVLGREK